ncbi:SpoIIE family protein phosphatase [Amycolatopsis australiensis]|uniref:Serine phosphatase RsbU, regulator of sigma subunit n=1 Tax=Amycolatopsis australiensis TaxID=546364 RepID=A0A1K1SFP9_9PSEU|nr:SpoIIE family protein phosphatase [Amycolatopsis australiensis]SFW83201.1 Serine phosphatase RsbU, regulator of sigma subunit [Amycolatopsis australiensis]
MSGDKALAAEEQGVPVLPSPAEVSANLARLADTVARLRGEVDHAHAVADGRALIELAKGVLMERLHCTPGDAARQLESLAERAGMTPLEFAADVVGEAAEDKITEVTQEFLARADGEESVAVRLRTAESGVLAAGDTQRVAESILEHALRPLGATAVAVWLAGPDGSLTLAGSAGFSAEEAARWRYVPPGVATPARSALTERDLVWFPTLTGAGLPSIGQHTLAGGGRVAVPTGTGGRIIGVVEMCWPDPLPAEPGRQRRQLEALAELCAHTLDTWDGVVAPVAADGSGDFLGELVDFVDGLHDPAVLLSPCLDGGQLSDFRIHHANVRFADPGGRPRSRIVGTRLLETYPLAAEESGLLDMIQRVYATGEPFRADSMAVTTLVDKVPLTVLTDVSVTRFAGNVLLILRIQDEAAKLAVLLQHAQRLGRIGGFEENVVTGAITWNTELFSLYGLPPTATPLSLHELAAHAHPDDEPAIGRFLRAVLHHKRPSSTAFRLQRSDGVARYIRVVAEPVTDSRGELVAVRGAYQDVSAQHWTEVALAATRDRLAETEQEAIERNRLTLQLQRAIMPPAKGPIAMPGLRAAVRYRPAEKEHLVGGDWYDAVALPTGEVLLCVGDVAGHGIDAATGMVSLRNALRGLAATGAGPAQLLTWLNLVAYHLTDHVTATAVTAVYDPASRKLRWARAGHLPPIVRHRDGSAVTLPLIRGSLLGAVRDVTYQEEEVQLDGGDILLIYTDGLIERRDRPVQETVARLVTLVERHDGELENQLDTLLTYSTADTDDDTCVVGIEVTASEAVPGRVTG